MKAWDHLGTMSAKLEPLRHPIPVFQAQSEHSCSLVHVATLVHRCDELLYFPDTSHLVRPV